MVFKTRLHMEPFMKQLGFLDFDIRLNRINKAGDPLLQLDQAVDWKVFRPTLEKAREKP